MNSIKSKINFSIVVLVFVATLILSYLNGGVFLNTLLICGGIITMIAFVKFRSEASQATFYQSTRQMQPYDESEDTLFQKKAS